MVLTPAITPALIREREMIRRVLEWITFVVLVPRFV